jgi:hypothetical protein
VQGKFRLGADEDIWEGFSALNLRRGNAPSIVPEKGETSEATFSQPHQIS